MMSYTVFYRSKFSATFDVPATLDKGAYKEVTTLEASDLEDVFRQMNVVHGDELPIQLKTRSLSVGDAVLDNVTGVLYYCAPIGWQKASWS